MSKLQLPEHDTAFDQYLYGKPQELFLQILIDDSRQIIIYQLVGRPLDICRPPSQRAKTKAALTYLTY